MVNREILKKTIASPITMMLFFLEMTIAFIYWRITYHQWSAMDNVGPLYYGFPFKYDLSHFGPGGILEFLGYLFLNLLIYYLIAVVLVYIYRITNKS